MTKPLTIGNVTVNPGEIARGGIPIGRDMYGNERIIPITVFRGAQEGPIMWLNGATHGDEPEGPFSIFLATKTLDVATLKGTVVSVPVLNVGAFAAGTRGDPLDSFAYDMNRAYPGSADGFPTERIAWAHWQAGLNAPPLFWQDLVASELLLQPKTSQLPWPSFGLFADSVSLWPPGFAFSGL